MSSLSLFLLSPLLPPFDLEGLWMRDLAREGDAETRTNVFGQL